MSSSFPISQAALIALATTIVGQVVAFVPSLASEKQALVSLASVAISVGFMVANAIHAHGQKPPPAK